MSEQLDTRPFDDYRKNLPDYVGDRLVSAELAADAKQRLVYFTGYSAFSDTVAGSDFELSDYQEVVGTNPGEIISKDSRELLHTIASLAVASTTGVRIETSDRTEYLPQAA